MYVAIIGSRSFEDFELVEQSIFKELDVTDITAIVSGGAKGADTLGEKFADKYKLNKIIYKPDWKKYGKGAGIVRNKSIIEKADCIFAFWDGKSKGTKNSIDLSYKLNKTLFIYESIC